MASPREHRDERVRDLSLLVTMLGMVGAAYAVGRVTGSESRCCDELDTTQQTLLLCQTRCPGVLATAYRI